MDCFHVQSLILQYVQGEKALRKKNLNMPHRCVEVFCSWKRRMMFGCMTAESIEHAKVCLQVPGNVRQVKHVFTLCFYICAADI